MKTVALHTLGCKLNFAETSTIGRQFVDRGYRIVDVDTPANVFVLNTCSVTDRADRECRQIVRRVLRNSPEAFVIVTGCYAQLRPGEIAAIDGVDLVVGTSEKLNLLDHVLDLTKRGIPQTLVSCIDDAAEFQPAYSADVGGRTRAFLKIQDGCDYPCAFCTIPTARGGSRSQSIDAVLARAQHLASEGYKEIVLTGVNVGDYGRTIGTSLFNLLRRLELVNGIERIRISSIEPNLLTKEMIDLICSSGKFCNHFHIPLQSGSDEVLKRMRRRYVTRRYRELVDYIKCCDPDAAIGVDIIVGFPGETEDRFDETYRLLTELPVSYLHVFTYSERPQTSAMAFSGAVESRIRFKRNRILRELGAQKRYSFYASHVGRILPVLFEAQTRSGQSSGLTTNYIRVRTESYPSLHPNTIRNILIVRVEGDECIGRIVKAHAAQNQSFIQSPITIAQ
jgi:threonylcarbamoyladenosine tRNA methylthiotransferase MtaB